MGRSEIMATKRQRIGYSTPNAISSTNSTTKRQRVGYGSYTEEEAKKVILDSHKPLFEAAKELGVSPIPKYEKGSAILQTANGNPTTPAKMVSAEMSDYPKYLSSGIDKKLKENETSRQDLLNYDVDSNQEELRLLESDFAAVKNVESQISKLKGEQEALKLAVAKGSKDASTKLAENQKKIARLESALEDTWNKYGSRDELGNLVYNKKEEITQIKRYQDLLKSNDNAVNDPNYNNYVEKGKAIPWKKVGKATGTSGGPNVSKTTYDDLGAAAWALYNHNNPNAKKELFDNLDNSIIFEQMTDAEFDLLAYYIGKDKETGGNQAETYIELMEETLKKRKGQEIYEQYLKDNAVLEVLYGALVGLDQVANGVTSLFNFKDDYIPASPVQVAGSLAREDLADDTIPWYNFKYGEWEDKIFGSSLGQMAYDTVQTTANMAPSIVASTVVGLLNPVAGTVTGATLMGASAAGNAYQEALNNGWGKGEARTYSTLVGASEALVSATISKVFGGKIVSEAVENAIKGVTSGMARFALNYGAAFVSEGIEEAAQEVLSPLFENIAFGYNRKGFEDIDWEEVAYSFLLGGLSGGMFETAQSGVKKISSVVSVMKDYNTAEKTQNLLKLALSLPAESKANKLATKYNSQIKGNGKLSVNKVYNLAVATENVLTERLTKSGVKENAPAIASAMLKALTTNQLNENEMALLQESEQGAKLLEEIKVSIEPTQPTTDVTTVSNMEKVETDGGTVNQVEDATFDGVDTPNGKHLDKAQQDKVKEIGKKLGREVVFEDFAKLEKFKGKKKMPDGYIDKNGKVHINYYAKKPVQFLLKHELTHYVGNKIDKLKYADFQNMVFDSEAFKDWMQSKGFASMTELKKDVFDRYSEVKNFNETKAFDEILADFVGDWLFGGENEISQKFIDMLKPEQKKTFMEVIKDIIEHLKQKFKGNVTVESEIAKLEDRFVELYNEAVASPGKENSNLQDEFAIAGKKANTANHNKLIDAIRRVTSGENSESVRQDTGWYKGPDGKWRYYIPDNELNADKLVSPNFNGGKLGDIIVHDKLFEAYPPLKNLDIRFDDLPKRKRGKYLSDSNEIVLSNALRNDVEELKDTLVHEIQHAIQEIEGFAPGGNKSVGLAVALNWAYDKVKDTQEFRNIILPDKKRDYLIGFALNGLNAKSIQELQSKIYRAIYGEVESRDVTSKRKLDVDALRDSKPDTDGLVIDIEKETTKFVENFTEMRYTEEEILNFFKGEQNDISGSNRNFEGRNSSIDGKSKRGNGRAYFLPAMGGNGQHKSNTTTSTRTDRPGISSGFHERSDTGRLVRGIEEFNSQDSEDYSIPFDTDAEYMSAVENGDMETAQRLVKETAKNSGYTIEAYHGTPNTEFTVFDRNRLGKGNDQYGAGFYFASNKEGASHYGNRVIDSALSIKNPIRIKATSESGRNLIDADIELTSEQAYEIVKRHPDMYDEENSPLGDYFDSYWEDGAQDWMIESLAEQYRDVGYLDSDLFRNYPNELHEALRDVTGYDGVEVTFESTGDKFYVAWFDNQMKSVDPVTYDDDGDVIPLSQRFNADEEDIRYSIPASSTPTELLDAYENGDITREEYLEALSKEKTLNPKEIADLTEEDANTTPKLKKKDGVSTDNKESKFYGSVLESSIFNDDFKAEVSTDSFVEKYKSVTNKETLQKAAQELDEGGEAYVRKWMNIKPERASLIDTAVGFILMDRYQRVGDYESAAAVTEKVREFGTAGGQQVQIFSILGRLTPDTMSIYAQRELDKAFEIFVKNKTQSWISKNKDKFKLTNDEIEGIRLRTLQAAMFEDNTRQKAIFLGEIAAILQSKIPPEKGDSMRAFQRNAMLLNPRTILRNIGGNFGMVPIYIASDLFGTIIDKQISKTTGTRVKGVWMPSSVKEMKRGFYESYDDFKRGIRTKMEDLNRFDITISKGKSFNENGSGFGEKEILKNQLNSVARALNKIDNFTSFCLEAGDRPFFEMWFMNSLNKQMQLNNVDTPTEQMIEVAKQEALERTWQDDNAFTRAVTHIKKGFNALHLPNSNYGFGDFVFKFVKTPSNIAKAIYDFSPAGFISAAANVQKLKNAIETDRFNAQLQREVVRSFSNAITGTLIYTLIAVGASLGLIKLTADDDEDKDVSNFEKYIMGIPPYSIEFFGQSITYDWAQPFGSILAIVAEYEDIKEDNPDMSEWDKVWKMVKAGGSTFAKQSFLKSMEELFSGDDIAEGIASALLSEPAAFVPQLASQTASFFDEYRRTTYDAHSSFQTAMNKVIAKIPGLRETLPKQVNSLGEDVKNNQYLNVWDSFMSPWNTYPKSSKEVVKDIYALYKESGDDAVMPRMSPNYFTLKGKRINFTTEEKAKIQRAMGDRSVQMLAVLFDSKEYQKLDNKQKVDVVEKIYDYSWARAKSELEYDFETLTVFMGENKNGDPILTKKQYDRMSESTIQKMVENIFLSNAEVKRLDDYDELVKYWINQAKK